MSLVGSIKKYKIGILHQRHSNSQRPISWKVGISRHGEQWPLTKIWANWTSGRTKQPGGLKLSTVNGHNLKLMSLRKGKEIPLINCISMYVYCLNKSQHLFITMPQDLCAVLYGSKKEMLFSVDWWITIIAKTKTKTWADKIENGIIEAIPLKTNFSLYLSLQGVNCFNIKYSICPSHNQHHTDNICLT